MKNHCLDDGTVRSFRDGEITGGRRAEVTAHVQACAACRRRLAEADAHRERVASRMTALAPAGGDAVPAADAAWHRLRTQMYGNSRTWSEWAAGWLRRPSPAWGLALATAFLALLFAFAPVRTAFGQFLGVFRVHKFAAIRIDPAKPGTSRPGVRTWPGDVRQPGGVKRSRARRRSSAWKRPALPCLSRYACSVGCPRRCRASTLRSA